MSKKRRNVFGNHIQVFSALESKDYDSIDGKDCRRWWEDTTGKKFSRCMTGQCRDQYGKHVENVADVGGHVIDLATGTHVYIVPMCSSCNNRKDLSSFSVLRNAAPECTNIGKQYELTQKASNIRLRKRIKRSILSYISQMMEIIKGLRRKRNNSHI